MITNYLLNVNATWVAYASGWEYCAWPKGSGINNIKPRDMLMVQS